MELVSGRSGHTRGFPSSPIPFTLWNGPFTGLSEALLLLHMAAFDRKNHRETYLIHYSGLHLCIIWIVYSKS